MSSRLFKVVKKRDHKFVSAWMGKSSYAFDEPTYRPADGGPLCAFRNRAAAEKYASEMSVLGEMLVFEAVCGVSSDEQVWTYPDRSDANDISDLPPETVLCDWIQILRPEN